MSDTFETLAQRSDAESFEPGEPIYRECEAGSVAFLLVEGEVVVESDGRPDEVVSSGELFGEAALFGEAQRNDSARAVTAARVVPIGPALYESLAATDSSFAWTVRAARSRRMKRLAMGALLVSLLVATGAHGQVWEVGNQLLTAGSASDGMGFGETLAVGDFNADGRSDLVVAATDAASNGFSLAGRVEVHFGSASGVLASASLIRVGWQEQQSIGRSLATGDFNGDGRDELAIGMPLTDIGSDPVAPVAGLVEVWRFGVDQAWHWQSQWGQAEPGILGGPEDNDQFGSALAVGDFDDDGYDDLAVGVRGEAIGDVASAGAVNVIYGSSTGLSATGNQIWYRGGGGIEGTLAAGEYLGDALAVGDFTGDGIDDLAIGIPGDFLLGGVTRDGSVVVLHGSSGAGLVAAGQERLDRQILGLFPAGESNSRFGNQLAAGDLDRTASCVASGTCADELLISAHSATTAGWELAGLAYAVYGSWALGELDPATGVAISQTVFDPVLGTPPEYHDQFGAAVALGVLGKLGSAARGSLVVGSPFEDQGATENAGCVHVVRDAVPGFDVTGNPEAQYLYSRPGFASAPFAEEMRFGAALATGDFDGDGQGDLAIGASGWGLDALFRPGAVQVLYGALFADGFESGGSSSWTH